MLRILQWLYTHVASVFSNVLAFHLDVACFYMDIAYLQWLYRYIASVCFKYFTYFRHMLQVFYLFIVICCNGYIHMLQTYVSIVSPSFN
jgi:hypothetical protein